MGAKAPHEAIRRSGRIALWRSRRCHCAAAGPSRCMACRCQSSLPLDDLSENDADVAAVLAGVGLRRSAPAAIEQDALPPTRAAIHKPSALVSFGLPDPLSFQV